MKRIIFNNSFVARRVLIAFFVSAGIACLLGTTGTLPMPARKLPFFGSQASAKVPHPAAAGLTFAERVSYQRAIEEVYWRHRIWPKERRDSKPALDAVMSQAQLEQKVANYLRNSQLVSDQRGSPITASELQAEMDRMAQHTKQPEVLHELFKALDSDPFVIAECLARPILAERLAAGPIVVAGVSPALSSLPAADTAPSTGNRISVMANLGNGHYKLPEIGVVAECTNDTWTATTTVNAPEARSAHTVVWTGSEMIIWGGSFVDNGGGHYLNTGGRYDPATDSWTSTSTTNAPTARSVHSAVWTGSEMIVWAGYDGTNELNTGGRYNPVTNSWIATSTTNAPLARDHHTAVWTGSEMIAWGGYGCGANCNLNSGGRYNPSTDTWTATSTINAPVARWLHTVEWTGSEMIIWGGTDGVNYVNTGGRYNPSINSWTATGVPNDVLGRAAHSAVWTGSEMIVWGGADSTFNDCNTGGRYDPTSDSWTATSTANAPSAREQHTAVWTGSEMIVWAGIFCCPIIDFNTGGRYNPGTDSWIPTSTTNAPHAREDHAAVWTGGEMIVWGGTYVVGNNVYFTNTGGRYCAQGGPSPTPTPTASPMPTATIPPTATPTATSTPTASATPTAIATATPTATATPRATPTPRRNPTPRSRPTPPPRR
jgi:N-acetylneuraminic acid mutarotase